MLSLVEFVSQDLFNDCFFCEKNLFFTIVHIQDVIQSKYDNFALSFPFISSLFY